MTQALQTTAYTGKFMTFVGDESFLTLLGLAAAPRKVISMYRLLLHSETPQLEKDAAWNALQGSGYGETYVAEIRRQFRAIAEYRADKSTETKPVRTAKRSAKKKPATKRHKCSGCGSGAKLTKLPHNYGGTRRYLYICASCLPEIAPIIGHRLTHAPPWRR